MKNFFITGTNSTIGKTIAETLLDEGHGVYGSSREAAPIHHPHYHHLQENLVKKSLPADFLPDKIDGMVYCPGSVTLRPFRVLSQEEFKNDLDLNVLGAIRLLQILDRKFNNGASVVLFSSVAVQTGMPFHASIAVSKGAVEGLTRSLAAEYAPRIRFNAIAPSLTESRISTRFIDTDKKREAMNDKHPLKRVGKPEDIASMAVFLLSDKAGWISGEVMHVDGGISSIS